MTKRRSKKPGFIFLKKGPFEGLEKYIDSQNIGVETKKVSYLHKAEQLMLSNPDNYKTNPERGLRTHSGKYFEILAQMIFGGLIKQKIEVLIEIKNCIYSKMYEIDLTIPEKKTFIEVKSTMQNESLKFLDFQIAEGVALQTMDEFESWSMFYLIFRRGIKKISSKFKNQPLEKLIEKISENIRSMFLLPFSMVYHLHTKVPDTCSRHNNQTYLTLTRFNESGLHNLLVNPEETIKCLGLNPTNYAVKRKKFPEEIEIDGFKINSFPVLLIQDKNYTEWVGTTKEWFKRELPKYKEAREIMDRIESHRADKEDYKNLDELERYEEPPPVIEYILNFGLGGGKKVIKRKEENKTQEIIDFKTPHEFPFEIEEPPEKLPSGEREPGQEG